MALKTDLIGVWCEGADPVTDQHTNGLTLTNNNTVATAAGKIGTAGDFEEGSSESLSRADEALLSTGNISWTEAVWIKMEGPSLPSSNQYISSKTTGVTDERVLLYRATAGENRFRFYIADFGVGVAASTFGLPSVDTWYYLQAQHDAAGDKIRIRVNDGAWDEQATGGTAPTDNTAAFYLGAYGNGGSPILFFDGLINQFAFWKGLKSDADLNAIYNSGNGLAFSSWDAVSGRVSRLAGIGGGLVGHRKGLI
jgi:Concanavalin A-like lectin/glucanases superfamily